MNPSLRHASVLVTGASSGIGAAIAVALGRQGAHVIAWGRDAARLTAVAERVRGAGGSAETASVELADPGAVEGAAAPFVDAGMTPDIVINNAGAGRFLAIDETTPDEARRQMELPYLAAFYVTRAFVEPMIARRRGAFMMINSPVSLAPWPGAVCYASSRWALRGLTRSLRLDLAGTGVAVGSFTPTRVRSEYFDHNPGSGERIPAVERWVGSLTPQQAADGVVRALLTRPHGDSYAGRRWAAVAPVAAAFPGAVSALYQATGWKRPERS